MAMLPLKLRVFDYIAAAEHPVTVKEITEALEPEYHGERQMNEKRVDFYIQSLMGVNMIKENEISFDEDGKLQISYIITDFGRSRVKYIPKGKDNSTVNIT